MRVSIPSVLCVALSLLILPISAQQFQGSVINNTLPWVPGSEITYFNILDANKKNTTLINYSSLTGVTGGRLIPSQIERVIVFIHGLQRDPGTYMSNMLVALSQIPGRPDVNFSNVQIVCPMFPNGDDKFTAYPWNNSAPAGGYGSFTNVLAWQSNGWINGTNNQYPNTKKSVSSYAVIDQVVHYFDNKALYPKLQQIVVAGHSAGAQVAQRWAAISTISTQTPLLTWVANPDSLLWLSADRPLDTSGCATYDYWKEGLSNYTNTYGASLVASGRAAALANYQSKDIAYARGLLDLGNDASTCGPYSQGLNRNERFFNFIKRFPVTYPSTIDFVQAGHDAGTMMASPAGQARLFLDVTGSKAYDFGCPRIQAGDDPFPSGACNTTGAVEDAGTFNGYTYAGCYTDAGEVRAMPFQAFVGNNNNAASCTAACHVAGYSMAGMEYGDECYCANSMTAGTLGPLLEMDCTMSCPGNTTEICGDASRLSVFAAGNVTIAVAPVSPAVAGQYTYQGCYTDNAGRVLQGSSSATNDMTVEQCAAFCGNAGTNAFGVEYTTQCFCGNSLISGSKLAPSTDCGMTCGGNSSELCGGPNRLNLYAINTTMLTAGGSVTGSTSTSTTASSTLPGALTTPAASATSTSLACPGSNATMYISGGTAAYAIECFMDHNGGDLSSATVTSFSGCIDTCASTKGCIDVSFVAPSACYMKSMLQPPVSQGNVWGARFVSMVTPNATSASNSSSLTPVTSTSMINSWIPTSSMTTTSAFANNSSTSSTVLYFPANTSSLLTTTAVATNTSSLLTITAVATPSMNTSAATSSSIVSATSVGNSSLYFNTSSIPTSTSVVMSATVPSTLSSFTTSLVANSSFVISATTSLGLSNSSSVFALVTSSTLTTSSVANSSIASTASTNLTSTSSSSVLAVTTSSNSTLVSSTTSSLMFSTSSSSMALPTATNNATSSGATFTPSTTSTASTMSTFSTSTRSLSVTSATSSTSSATTSLTVVLPSGFAAVGCYKDSNTRTLPVQAYANSSNTPALCANACSALGYAYSGTEYADECWCGSTVPSTTPSATASDCHMACSGDKKQNCGAGNRLSVVSNSNAPTFGPPYSIDGWYAYGCMSDSPSSRTLGNTVSLKDYGGGSNATIENGLKACSDKGYSYCGFEYYSEVYGTSKDPNTSLILADARYIAGYQIAESMAAIVSAGCNYKCTGNPNEACGGSNRLMVYWRNGLDDLW